MQSSTNARHRKHIADSQSPEIWLSILIPVYNVAPYLRECVDSVMSQVDDDGVEIILLDDASTDDSRAICEQICVELEAQVRLIEHNHNRGLSAARNSLIEEAQGTYIWFLDSDDKMLPGALAKLREIVAADAPDIVLCDYRKEKRSRRPTFKGASRSLQQDRETLISGVFARRRLHSWSKISKRRLWGEDLRFPEGRNFEDISVSPRLLLRAQTHYYVPEAWVYYRDRPGSILSSMTQSPNTFDDRKNDDLAHALGDYAQLLRREMPHAKRQTSYYVTRFMGIEFRKLGTRLARARLRSEGWASVSAQLRRYLITMQGSVPLTFSELGVEYLRRFKFGSWFGLQMIIVLAWHDGALAQYSVDEELRIGVSGS